MSAPRHQTLHYDIPRDLRDHTLRLFLSRWLMLKGIALFVLCLNRSVLQVLCDKSV